MEVADQRHFAVIDHYSRTLKFFLKGEMIVNTNNALILKEVGTTVYNPVFYIPKADVMVRLNSEPKRSSYCPIKGEASYWNLDEPTDDYFAWSYEEPLPRSKKIKGHIAFNIKYLMVQSEPL